jgi:prepilin-type N-terminal cleavage/methylation domain-containing protein
MKGNRNGPGGFTLIEMLVAIAIVAILGALLLPVIGHARARASVAPCINNLRQINMSARMYADDSSDAIPPATNDTPPICFTGYTVLLKSYVGTAAAPEREKLFACPADTFCYKNGGWDYLSHGLHEEKNFDYSSYAFNGGNFLMGNPPIARWPGIAGVKLTSVTDPARTVLVLEFAGLLPYSWHEPVKTAHSNNAKDVVSFVDGHTSLTGMYWNAAKPPERIEAWHYDPPAGYDYKWSGN